MSSDTKDQTFCIGKLYRSVQQSPNRILHLENVYSTTTIMKYQFLVSEPLITSPLDKG